MGRPAKQIRRKKTSVRLSQRDEWFITALVEQAELKTLSPYSPAEVLGGTPPATPVQYTEVRGLVESLNGCYGFISEGNLVKLSVMTPAGPQEGIRDDRSFDGWRRLA